MRKVSIVHLLWVTPGCCAFAHPLRLESQSGGLRPRSSSHNRPFLTMRSRGALTHRGGGSSTAGLALAAGKRGDQDSGNRPEDEMAVESRAWLILGALVLVFISNQWSRSLVPANLSPACYLTTARTNHPADPSSDHLTHTATCLLPVRSTIS